MDTGYTFAVMAFNKLGESGYSAEVQGNTASETTFNKIMIMMTMVVVAIQTMPAMKPWMRKITGNNSNNFDNVDNMGVLVFPTISFCFSKAFAVLRRGRRLKICKLGI